MRLKFVGTKTALNLRNVSRMGTALTKSEKCWPKIEYCCRSALPVDVSLNRGTNSAWEYPYHLVLLQAWNLKGQSATEGLPVDYNSCYVCEKSAGSYIRVVYVCYCTHVYQLCAVSHHHSHITHSIYQQAGQTDRTTINALD